MRHRNPSQSYKSSLPAVNTGKDRKRIRWKRWVIGLPLAAVVPFFLLIRLSTWLYLTRGFGGWAAIAVSAAVSTIMFAAVLAVVAGRMGIRPGRWALKAAGVIVLAYAAYLLVYVSAANVKAPHLKETYTNLHPILRVAASSFILLDSEAVLTGTGRTPDDYERMDLREPSASLHYEQSNGYVHAVDLRTIGRSKGRNVLTKVYFDVMGFSTLRHTGTADHLHVSLPVR